MLGFLWSSRGSGPSRPDSPPETFDDVSCPVMERDCTKRTEFGTVGCTVYAWPSTGGVLIKGGVDIVEMEYLGLARLRSSSRSPSQDDEDCFCDWLRTIGAKWWSSEEDYIKALLGWELKTAEEGHEVVFGWP